MGKNLENFNKFKQIRTRLFLLIIVLFLSILLTKNTYSNNTIDILSYPKELNLTVIHEIILNIQNINNDEIILNTNIYAKNSENQKVTLYNNPNTTLFATNNILKHYYIELIKIENKLDFIKKKDEFPFNLETYTHINNNFEKHLLINDSVKKELNKITSNLINENDTLFEIVMNLNQYTHNYIEYDLNFQEDQNPNIINILKTKKGVCVHYSKLLTMFLRSLNIPAKEVNGFAISEITNDFEGHRWVEVYFPNNGWIPIDPTFNILGLNYHIKYSEDELYTHTKYTNNEVESKRNTKLIPHIISQKQIENILNTKNIDLNTQIPYFTELNISESDKLKPNITYNLSLFSESISLESSNLLNGTITLNEDYLFHTSLNCIAPNEFKCIPDKINLYLESHQKKEVNFLIKPITSKDSKYIYHIPIMIIDSFQNKKNFTYKMSEDEKTYLDLTNNNLKNKISPKSKEKPKTSIDKILIKECIFPKYLQGSCIAYCDIINLNLNKIKLNLSLNNINNTRKIVEIGILDEKRVFFNISDKNKITITQNNIKIFEKEFLIPKIEPKYQINKITENNKECLEIIAKDLSVEVLLKKYDTQNNNYNKFNNTNIIREILTKNNSLKYCPKKSNFYPFFNDFNITLEILIKNESNFCYYEQKTQKQLLIKTNFFDKVISFILNLFK